MDTREPVITAVMGTEDGVVRAADVLAAVGAWLRALDNIACLLSPQKHPVRWIVQRLSLNSPLDCALQAPVDAEQLATRVVRHYLDGVRDLAEPSGAVPAFFTETALRKVKRLAECIQLYPIRFVTGDAEVSVSRSTSDAVDRLLGTARVQVSTVEGRLERISIHKRNVTTLWDPVTMQAIECRFAEDRMAAVKQAFGRRVQISGPVRYNALGQPQSVQLEHLRIMRDQNELPQARDLEGISITGGMDPTEYLRRTRDGGRETGLLG
jgi:hypothetical protein